VTGPAWLRGETIAAALARPDNGFTLVRLLLALAVIVSHAFSIQSGSHLDEPLTRLTGFTLGEHAVNGFFVVSGFLVTMSFERRGWRDYVLARVLRIAPGVVMATLVTGLVFGGLLTRLPLAAYLSEPALWRFIVQTPTSFKSATALPGVFENNAYPFPLATVWTLRYEVYCYAGVLAAGVAGILSRRWAILVPGALLAAVFLAALVYPDAGRATHTTFRLLFLFGAGGALYLWRDAVPLSGAAVMVLFVATWIAADTALYRPLLFAAEAYGVIYASLMAMLARPALEPPADLSYGVYLYGWPVQQMLDQFFPAASPWLLLPPALALAMLLAALSWYLVEKPALAVKARLVSGRPPKASPQPAG
jgi:peptidoglycan/LPS O-acetylase OafA/YrhL